MKTTVQLGLHKDLGLEAPTDQKPNLQLIDVKDIKNPPTELDLRYTKEEWAGFLQSVQSQGIRDPIEVRPHPDGGYLVTDGRHRLDAARRLKLKVVPAIVRRDVDDKAAAIGAFTLNFQRKESTPLQEAKQFAAARDAGLTIEDIAASSGVSVSTVRERLDLTLIPEALAARVGVDRRIPNSLSLSDVDDVLLIAKSELPKDAKQRAFDAAMKCRQSWEIKRRALEAVPDKRTQAWLDEHLTGDYYLLHDAKLAKQLTKVKQVQVGKRTLFLDVAAAKATIAAFKAEARAKEGPTANHGSGMTDRAARDQARKTREKNRVHKIQLDLLAKKVTGAVSYGKDFTDAILLRYVENLGLIGSRKGERAAFEAVTGIKGWGGRGSEIAKYVRDAKVGSLAANRILHAALYFDLNNKAHYSGGVIPPEWCNIVLGKSKDAIMAQAKREVAEDLKAAAERQRAKAKKESSGKAAAMKRKPAPAEEAAGHADDLAEGAASGPDIEADLEA